MGLLRTISLGLPTGESPFHNLRRLTLQGIDAETMSYASVAFHPNLTSIETHNCNLIAMRSLCVLLGRVCPSLKSIRADYIPIHATPALARFPTLETLECPQLELTHVPLLLHLASLPTLQSLSTSLITGTDSWVRKLDPATAFGSLKTLKLYGGAPPSNVLLFLRSISSKTLEDLSIHLDFDPPSRFLPGLFGIISTFTTLHSFSLKVASGVQEEGENHTCSLEPLYRLPLLQVLQLEGVIVRAITHKLIPGLGKAWPRLECLQIELNETPPGYSLTLEALGLFATHLPKLSELSICLDATVSPTPTTTSRARSLIPINLNLGSSPASADSWGSVAAYISSVYPNAVLLDESFDDPSFTHAECWRNIAQMIPIISSARKEEWDRAALGTSGEAKAAGGATQEIEQEAGHL